MIAFGPIPSRRLGQSLGVNNIPPKVCSFNCVYCQVGITTEKTIQRRQFYTPEEIYQDVARKVEEARSANAAIDYLTIVPDGEPTLDIHLGDTINRLRTLGIRIAVFTNSTLLWDEQVREELKGADYVSVKVDAVEEKSWYRVNRPSSDLSLPRVLEGIRAFAERFPGELVTETMLIRGINDHSSQLAATAAFVGTLDPNIAYLGLPTRPPVETWVQSPDEQTLNEAYHTFSGHLSRVELLAGFSPDTFSVSGDAIQNLLSILAVHPMRESEAISFLERGGAGRNRLEALVGEGVLVRVFHEGQAFYLRKLGVAEPLSEPDLRS